MNEYIIAKYIRLSQDDSISESMSISNQRLLLDEHIEEMNIPNAEILEFVDNGYTGTNLDRPGFQEMIELARYDRINCIIVKDFSRFARSELESGYYIERIFPLFNVRFIAIGDNFDSNDHADGTVGLDSAFKFLIHEYYSKDLSKKIKSAKRVLMENGENIVAGAVHGYRKNDKEKWEQDPDAANAISLIFQLALDGLSTAQIRDKLFLGKFPAPREYSLMKRGKDIAPKFLWPTKTIFIILKNEQYTGSYVAGKHESTRIGGKGVKDVNKSDWIIIPDSHPAIVSKEDFAKVQDMLARPKELSPNKPVPNKISNSFRIKSINGERKSPAVPYGYARDKNGDWVINDNTAHVVIEIFEMTLQGLSKREISEKLHECGYPTPLEQRKIDNGHDIQPTNKWMPQSVKDILKDEQYIGTYIAGKTFQISTDKKYHAPKSEWIRIPDKHPVIISKEIFEQVQIICASSRKNMKRRDYLLLGKAICGCCGFALSYNDSTAIRTYRCMKTHADPAANCHKMKANADELEQTVMKIIKKQAEVVLAADDFSGFRKSDNNIQLKADIENQIRQLSEHRQQCYERFIVNEIDKDVFQKLKAEYTAKIDNLTNRLAMYKQTESGKIEREKIASLANNALNDTATPRDIINALADKVLVFPNNHIEIRWKFIDFSVHI